MPHRVNYRVLHCVKVEGHEEPVLVLHIDWDQKLFGFHKDSTFLAFNDLFIMRKYFWGLYYLVLMSRSIKV